MARPKCIPKDAINLAARAGFLSKSLFKEFLMKNRPTSSLNRSWRKLIDSGYFITHSDPRMGDIYLLNKRKRETSALSSHTIVSPPYSSLIRHDEIALRGILLIEDHGFLDTWKVESEFKKLKEGAVRLEGNENRAKYPDAILNFKSQIKPIRVAVEIELSLKDKRRYQRILNAYSFAEDLDLVLFVCANDRIEKTIAESSSKYFYPSAGSEISFMRQSEWSSDPILADVRIKNSVMSLGTWLDQFEKAQYEKSK